MGERGASEKRKLLKVEGIEGAWRCRSLATLKKPRRIQKSLNVPQNRPATLPSLGPGDSWVPTPPSPCSSFFSLRCRLTSCSSSSSSSVKTASMTGWEPSTRAEENQRHGLAPTSTLQPSPRAPLGATGIEPRLKAVPDRKSKGCACALL